MTCTSFQPVCGGSSDQLTKTTARLSSRVSFFKEVNVETVRSMTKGHNSRNEEVLAILQQRWPKCFSTCQPLRIGIFEELASRLCSEITPEEVSAALRAHVSSESYLRSVREGTPRIALNGEVAGVVDKFQAAFAANKLVRVRSEKVIAEIKAKQEIANAGRRRRA
jgi:sRNA-binding protein